MTLSLESFESHVARIWRSIPSPLKDGVVRVIVERIHRLDPDFGTISVFGECRPDPLTALLPDAPIRSVVVLYYGSFVVAAEREPEFDWIGEIEETLYHELRHHLDWREGHDALGEEEDLETENHRRLGGESFDRTFHRHATRLVRGVTLLAAELFIEVRVHPRDWPMVWTHVAELSVGPLTLLAGPASSAERPHREVFVTAHHVDESSSSDARRHPLLEVDWEYASVVFVRRRVFFRQRSLSLTWLEVG